MLFRQEIRKEESLGSGVWIGEDGLIRTAAHVIQSAEKITIDFTDVKIEDLTSLELIPIKT